VIAAGVGDDSSAALFGGEGSDLVVAAPQLERADGLKVFRFEVKLAVVFDAFGVMDMRRDQFCTRGDATQARLCFANIVESYDRAISVIILRGGRASLREVRAESKRRTSLARDDRKLNCTDRKPAMTDNCNAETCKAKIAQISSITGMISGRFCVCLEI
jgi:hypothetical protein